jgi:hypothetical protein
VLIFMIWEKTEEGRQVRYLELARGGVSCGGVLPRNFDGISGPKVAVVYPIRTLVFSGAEDIGDVKGLRAGFVGVDSERTLWHLDRLVADMKNGNSGVVASWSVNSGLAMVDKIMHGTEPYHLDPIRDGSRSGCGVSLKEYDFYSTWSRDFVKPMEELMVIVRNSNLFPFLNEARAVQD